MTNGFSAGRRIVAFSENPFKEVEGQTMNAVLLDAFAGHWTIGGLRVGYGFVVSTLAAEAAVLFVAAQAGLIDGPHVIYTGGNITHPLTMYSINVFVPRKGPQHPRDRGADEIGLASKSDGRPPVTERDR